MMNLKIKIPLLIVLSLLLAPLPIFAYSVETTNPKLKEKIKLECNENLFKILNKIKGNFSKPYTNSIKSIERKFDNKEFPIFDIQQLFDQLKNNVPKRTDLKAKIYNCQSSLVAYYKEEYIKTCIEDKEGGTKKCKKNANLKERWFNQM